MFSAIGSGVLAAVGFGLLVFVHEMGHFLAAKFQGMRVEAFSLGFGPCLKYKWGDTEYRLSLIPLGGYVKLAGEEPDSKRELQPGDFHTKTVGQRAIVFVAGVFMNIVFGFVFFMVAYRVGVPVIPSVVHDVVRGSAAWKLNLQPGDVITRVGNNAENVDFEDLKTAVILADEGETISLGIERAGRQLNVDIMPEYNEFQGMMAIGIVPPTKLDIGEFNLSAGDDDVEAKRFRIAYDAGMRTGDKVTAVQVGDAAPAPISTLDDYFSAIEYADSRKPVKFFIERDGEGQKEITVKPVPAGKDAWVFGVNFGATRIVSAVRNETWAAAVGFKTGDEVFTVDGKAVRSPHEIEQALDAAMDRAVAVKVRRGNAEKVLNVPVRKGVGAPGRIKTWDVLVFEYDDNLVVDRCMPGLPAAEAGVMPGDRVTAIDGEAVETRDEFIKLFQLSGGREMRIAWVRDGQTMTATAAPVKRHVIAIPWRHESVTVTVKAGIGRAAVLGTRKSFQWIVRIYSTLRSLIRGTISPKNLNGPVAIFYVTYKAATRGLGYLLYLLGLISVNLGVLNLLPIPILDGGQLVFAAAEKVMGKPVNERLRGVLSYMGLVAMLGMLAVAMWNDIRMLFFG